MRKRDVPEPRPRRDRWSRRGATERRSHTYLVVALVIILAAVALTALVVISQPGR